MGISSSLGSSALLPAGLGFRNVLINGDMQVWQRGTSGSVGGTVAYTADRWQSITFAGGTMNWSQVSSPSTPIGSRYSLRIQRPNAATSTASMNIAYSCETVDSLSFAGKPVVFSFYARCGANFSAASSALNVQVRTGTGTDQSILNTGFTGSTNIVDTTATLTTSWQRFQFFATAGSSITQIGVLLYFTPVGTAGAADHFEITGVQLEQNLQPTPFEQRPIGVELALCQRYYQRYTATGTDQAFASGTMFNSTTPLGPLLFSVMRSAPTITFSGTYDVVSGGAVGVASAVAAGNISSFSAQFSVTGITATQGHGIYVRQDSGYYDMNAEL
jgi:hypothetical protein